MKPLTRASRSELEDLLEIGAVREDLRRDRLEHRSARLPRDDVGGLGDVAHPEVGRPPSRRRCADCGFSTRIVRHPAARPASASTSESPIIQLRERSMSSVGGGLQQHPRLRLPTVARPRQRRGRSRRGGAGSSGSRRSRLLGRRAVERRARAPREGPRARPCPWPRLVGSRQRRYGSRASGYDGSRRPLPGRAGRPPSTCGPSNAVVRGSQTSSTRTPSRSRKTARVAHLPSAASTDSHFPGAVTRAGCETRRCQTTAWNSST